MIETTTGATRNDEGGIDLTETATRVAAFCYAADLIEGHDLEWEDLPELSEKAAFLVADQLGYVAKLLFANAESLARRDGIDAHKLMESLR